MAGLLPAFGGSAGGVAAVLFSGFGGSTVVFF